MGTERTDRWDRSLATEWTTHSGGPREDPGEWIYTGETRLSKEDGGWLIRTHWFAVDGQVIPAGVDIRSFTSHDDEPAAVMAGHFTDVDTPRAVTRVAMNGLPLGAVIDKHRAEAWNRLKRLARAEEDVLGPGAAGNDPNRSPTLRPLLDRMERGSNRTVDENRRWAAQLHRELGKPRDVIAAMQAAKVMVRGNLVDPRVVRRWIKEGYELERQDRQQEGTKQ